MPKYLVQGSYTDQGLKGLLNEGGSKRRAVVEQLATEMGGNLEAFYFAFGSDDFVIILEFAQQYRHDGHRHRSSSQRYGEISGYRPRNARGYGPSGAKRGQFPPAGVAEISKLLLS
jgi:hypothetical protein